MTRRTEDTAEGCRSLAEDNRVRATAMINPRMRASLERSADAWIARAELLDRLQVKFEERVAGDSGSIRKAQ